MVGGLALSHDLGTRRDLMDRGLHSLAAKDLLELLDRNPGSDEAAYLLGTCEKARGRTAAAAEAWSKISPLSPFGFRALEGRVHLEVESGRLTSAEHLIKNSREQGGIADPDQGILLGPIYCQEGRFGEALLLIEGLWDLHNKLGTAASETAINHLRLYIQLQMAPIAEGTIRAGLERAGQIAPDDDRIWLWKASLALRTRSFDEAEVGIDQCLKRRPEDPLVWHARLDWAVATRRAALVVDAIRHLPSALLDAGTAREADGLAGRPARRRQRGTGESRAADCHRPDRRCRSRPTGRALYQGRTIGLGRGATPTERRGRTTSGSLPHAVRPEPAAARRRGDGPAGRTTRPPI